MGNVVDFLNPTSENFFVYKLIDLLKEMFEFLFVPSEQKITSIADTVYAKFAFVDTIKISINSLFDIINNIGTAPKVTLNVNATKYTEAQNITILDLDWYKPYKSYGDLILTGFIYAFFLWRFFINLPNIISGTGGIIQYDYMVDDINAYKQFGFGRSSSLSTRQDKKGGIFRR